MTRRSSSLTHRPGRRCVPWRFRTAHTQPAKLGFGNAGLSTWLTSAVTHAAPTGAEPPRTSRPAARRQVRVEPDHHAVDDGLGLVPAKAPRVRSAHAGGVAPALTGSSIEPDTGNYVMVRETLALHHALPAARANISADEKMDDIIEPVHDAIAIARCRELLGDEALGTSDADVDAIRRHADAMAHVLIEILLSDPPRA